MQKLKFGTESVKENKKIIISPFMNWKSKLAKERNKQIVEQNKSFIYIYSMMGIPTEFKDGDSPDHSLHKTLDNQIVMIKHPTFKE